MAGLFGRLRDAFDPAQPVLFLDGAALPQRAPAWSFLALRPSASLCVREGEAWTRERDGAWRAADGSPWELLRALHASARPAAAGTTDAPFSAGVAGFVSYDAARLIERLPTRAEADIPLPWLMFHRFDRVEAERLLVDTVVPPSPSASEREAEGATGSIRIGPITARTSAKEFEAMVVRAKAHIRAGDVFQVNLSHRLECDVEGSPVDLYGRLRAVNPAPFSAFYHSGALPWDVEGFSLLSSSPERLFSLTRGRLEARPIAGTRRRDADPARDEALVAELRADPKEQAEHVMLVDLARNDLGRVAAFGSVRVAALSTVETYRTVHHLVSVVDAQLAKGNDWVDALRAMFPGGTITGAPKVRSMEIIDELEPVRRGAYTGSLGWANAAGDCDLNILIRTIVLHRGRAHLQVGAGIVEESDPRREHEETLAKAKGLLLALDREAPS